MTPANIICTCHWCQRANRLCSCREIVGEILDPERAGGALRLCEFAGPAPLSRSRWPARSFRRAGITVTGDQMAESSRPMVVAPIAGRERLSAHVGAAHRRAGLCGDRPSYAQCGLRRTTAAGSCRGVVPIDPERWPVAPDARASAAPRRREGHFRAISVVRTRRPGSAQNVRLGRLPLDLLRPLQTGKSTMVFIRRVRQPGQG